MNFKKEVALGLILLILSIFLFACTPPVEETATPSQAQKSTEVQNTPTTPVLNGSLSILEAHSAIEGTDWPPDQELLITHLSGDEGEKETLTVITNKSGEINWTDLKNRIEDGDKFIVEVDHHSMVLPVSLVSVVADPDQKNLQGIAQPDTRVTITIEEPAGEYIDLETYSDQEGYFEFDLAVITNWNDDRHFFWISHFYHPNAATSISNQSLSVERVSGDADSKFLLRRLNIANLSNSQTGNILWDYDVDGDLDLILSQFGPEPQEALPLIVYENDGNGIFTEAVCEDVFGGTAPEFFNLTKWIIADFNGDGLDDLYLADGGQDHQPFPGGQNRLLIQTITGQLRDVSSTNIPEQLAFTHYAAAGDIDNDGDIDIFDCNVWSSATIGPRLLINDGTGSFQEDTSRIPTQITNMQRKFTSSLFVDVELDGDLDLVLGGHDNSGVSDVILINDGLGYFSYPKTPGLPPRLGGVNFDTVSMSTVDFNHDGYPDLLMSVHRDYQYDPNLQLLVNNGDGTFRDETDRIEQDWIANQKPGCTMSFGSGWLVSIFIVDPNDDGWDDFIVTGASCLNSLLFTNNQGEGYAITENYNEIVREDSYGTRYLWALTPGDVDGDEDLDLVTLFTGLEQLIVLRK